jgi:ribonuclease P protein component
LSELGPAKVQVAFSVGRKYGNAVARNRLRRRLREIMRAMTRDGHSASSGAYLVIAHPNASRLSFGELRRTVEAACREVAS